jgi:hypothetical protein
VPAAGSLALRRVNVRILNPNIITCIRYLNASFITAHEPRVMGYFVKHNQATGRPSASAAAARHSRFVRGNCHHYTTTIAHRGRAQGWDGRRMNGTVHGACMQNGWRAEARRRTVHHLETSVDEPRSHNIMLGMVVASLRTARAPPRAAPNGKAPKRKPVSQAFRH